MGDADKIETPDDKWLTRLLTLLPWFIAVGLARYIGALGEFSDFELTGYSLCLSLVIALTMALARKWWGLVAAKLKLGHGGAPPNQASIGYAFAVLAMSTVAGLLIAVSYDNNFVLRLSQVGLGRAVTKRSSARPLAFLFSGNSKGIIDDGRSDLAQAKQAWVDVLLEGDEHFAGFPRLFEMGKERTELFLSPACTVSEAGAATRIEGPGVLIPEDKIVRTIFIDQPMSECKRLWDRKDATLACAAHWIPGKAGSSSSQFEFEARDLPSTVKALARGMEVCGLQQVAIDADGRGARAIVNRRGVLAIRITRAHHLVAALVARFEALSTSRLPMGRDELCAVAVAALDTHGGTMGDSR